MSTSSTPVTVGTPPSTTEPANPPLEPAAPFQTQVAGQDWQPPPTLIALPEDTIVGDCVQAALPDYYFLDIGQEYVLRDIGVGTNYSLTGLELSGFYYLDRNTVPRSRPEALRVSFGGQEMIIRSWTPTPADICAQFTFTVRPDDISGIHGPLRFTLLETTTMIPTPRILVSGVDVDLLLQSSPNESPAPDGGLDSTADSSIGQSTNQTAAPASGNVPVSTASSSSSSKASVIAPAIVVPVVVVLAALAAFFLWRRHRRARLAPSAAFRADHADAVEAMERQGGTVGLGGTGTVQIPSASASLPTQSSSYFPLDEKRPLNP